MSSRSGVTAVILLAAGCLLAVSLLSCNIAAVPGRFTYTVKYSISYTEGTTALNPNVTRKDSTGINPPAIPVTSTYSEEFNFSYTTDGYDNQFVPELTVQETLDEVGESLTATISWKDYKTDFQEQVLASYSATCSSSPVNINEILISKPIPE